MRRRRMVDARMILCASPVYHPYRPEWHHWWSMLKSESGGGNELIWFWFNWVWLFINEKKHWYYVCPCDLWWIHTLHFICLEKLWTAFLFRCYLFCMLEGFPMFLKVIFFLHLFQATVVALKNGGVGEMVERKLPSIFQIL